MVSMVTSVAGPRPCAVVVTAPAKLNLFLELRRRRLDGYHDLESLMVGFDLFDDLTLRPQSQPGLSLTCSDPELPIDESNLVHRAARLLPTGEFGLHFDLTKRIPPQAGMGGGSSDAAAALVAVRRSLGLPTGDQELLALAGRLGSDVGFFLNLPAAWCTGRGEIVEPVRIGGTVHVVAVKPAVGCPTAAVYQQVTVPESPRSGDLARSGLANGDPDQLARGLFNRLEEAAFRVAPAVRTVHERLSQCRALAVQVTGSGSTVFALACDRADAERIADQYRSMADPDDRIYVLRSLPDSITG